ncbi:sialoadhesin-like [Menidia menidia]
MRPRELCSVGLQAERKAHLRLLDAAELDLVTSPTQWLVLMQLCAVLCVSEVLAQSGWGVTYAQSQICAVEGSAVEIGCSYTYPYSVNYKVTEVDKTFWFRREKSSSSFNLVSASKDSFYKGRVRYLFGYKVCSLRITDLKQSDSAEYGFIFTTNQEGGSVIGSPGVFLSVTALQVQLIRAEGRGASVQAQLECRSSCPSASVSYVWTRNTETLPGASPAITVPVAPSDRVSCAVRGQEQLPSAPVYIPEPPSVAARPSAEVVEGSTVTLSCSSDANPAALYSWYREPGGQPFRGGSQLLLSSVQPSDSGYYRCEASNQLGTRLSRSIFVDVQYGPEPPSVAASPSAEVVEGSTVTLSCSSDANPAALYSWYREQGGPPQAAGQSFNITDVRAEHAGRYSCEARNSRGSRNSSLLLTVVSGSRFFLYPSATAASSIRGALLVLVPILLVLGLWIRKKRAGSSQTGPKERVQMEQVRVLLTQPPPLNHWSDDCPPPPPISRTPPPPRDCSRMGGRSCPGRRTRQNQAEPDKTRQNQAEPERTRENQTKLDRTRQNQTEPDRTRQN